MKALCPSMFRVFQRARLFIANPFKQRKRLHRLQKLEAERLDRICHPEKYRGK